MNKILLVDDEKNILLGYKRNLRSKFDVHIAEGGKEGLDILKEHGPFAVVVSDFKMPGMDGVEFLKLVREKYPDTVRMMLTGYADLDSAMNAINEGNIYRFLTKPCSAELFAKNLYDATGQYQLINAEKELLNNTLKGSINILIEILSVVNPGAFSRAVKFKNLSKQLLTRLGKEITWENEIGALLSQIGLVTVPSSILEKMDKNFQLTDDEKTIFNGHPEFGKTLLKKIPRLESIANGISFQLQTYNGVGGSKEYKVGENIPFMGRLLKVMNDYENLIHLGLNQNQAIEELDKNHDFYDPDIWGALVAEASGFGEGQIISSKELAELKPGMILANGVKDINNVLLLPKGGEISEISLMKLLNYNKITKIKTPIKIIEHTK
ncbi:MAG: response regulator [Melioribacteraceae bacterium]|nr:response regulator [Melioribacteraceae bacterium]